MAELKLSLFLCLWRVWVAVGTKLLGNKDIFLNKNYNLKKNLSITVDNSEGFPSLFLGTLLTTKA